MGFFLTDAIKSALTPAGTNARNRQVQNQAGVANYGNQLVNIGGQQALDASKFNAGFDPQLQNAIRSLAQSQLTGSGIMGQANNANAALRAGAMSQSIPLAIQNNPQLAEAYRMQLLNKAQDQGNQNLLQAMDPQRRQQALMALMQILSQYQQGRTQLLNTGAGLVYGQPTVQVQPGIMDALAPFLGNQFGARSQMGGNRQ